MTTETTAERWARLTEPLDTSPPVILTPAALVDWAELTDELRAGRAADQDLLDEWHGKAVLATLGPLDDWMHKSAPPLPAMTP